MTLTREDPQVLRAGLPPAWFALGCGLATTLGTIWGLRTYGTDLLHAAHELLPEAPLAELRTPLALLFTALPGLWTLVRAVGLATPCPASCGRPARGRTGCATRPPRHRCLPWPAT